MTSRVLFADIDNTVTFYRPGSLSPERLLHGNFLFPILQQHLHYAGYSMQESSSLIQEEITRNVFWSYSSLIESLNLPSEKVFAEFRQWHRDNILVHQDAVAFIHQAMAKCIPVYFISNNPVDGCSMKLACAGLCTEAGTPLPGIAGIFGTDVMKGCKDRADCWRQAISTANLSPQQIVTFGDNVQEDGEIPLAFGVFHSIIIPRAPLPAIDLSPQITIFQEPIDSLFSWFFS
jgi:hypothetical protein